ncbi:MAG: lysylphosphatidylglycerol synthase transmembrane domain-containing protein [Pseudonocardiaceae bacterium]
MGSGQGEMVALTGQTWRRAAVAVVGLAAAGLAGRVLFDSSDELFTAADTLTSVRLGWVVVAVLVEVLSYVARGVASALVLRRGGAVVGPMTMAAATLAGDGAAYCLPFGFAASGVVMVGVLRRRQVGAALAGWMFAVCSVFYVASITVLTIVAVQIPGADNPIPGLQTIGFVILGVLALLGAGYALLRRPAVRFGLARSLPNVHLRSVHLPMGWLRPYVAALRTAIKTWADQLRAVRLPPVTGIAVFILMTVSWLADVAVLALAFVALHSTPPWTGLLLAYCAGQIAASMPVTPGGIGVVEGSITLALVAFGGDETITLAAVLLYRLIAYWSCIPAGGLAWLALRGTSRAPTKLAVGTHPDPVTTGVAEVESTS